MLQNIKKQLKIKTKQPGIFHIFIAEKLKKKIEIEHTNIIKRDDVTYLISRHMNMRCVNTFLNEMENFGLIKQINKQKIELLK